ncbi:MAG: hypothetical protein M1832_006122 [Thelocarpon impressellum]|nr:MAG: hypothetical protein M1832_006122 [Thelocarpon impressellum]
MPPHLHPRSAWTTSLFTTTLLASFLVVGMPHLLPCPAARRDYADVAEGRRQRRRMPRPAAGAPDGDALGEEGYGEGDDAVELGRRECPVPKPRGLLGEVLGFRDGRRRGDGCVEVESSRPENEPGSNR